jgi:hypothetical protein
MPITTIKGRVDSAGEMEENLGKNWRMTIMRKNLDEYGR